MSVDTKAIMERANAATPGPWTRRPNDEWMVDDAEESRVAETNLRKWVDAEFIAHARTDVPALCAEVDRLRAEAADCAENHYTAEEGRALETERDAALAEVDRLRERIEEYRREVERRDELLAGADADRDAALADPEPHPSSTMGTVARAMSADDAAKARVERLLAEKRAGEPKPATCARCRHAAHTNPCLAPVSDYVCACAGKRGGG